MSVILGYYIGTRHISDPGELIEEIKGDASISIGGVSQQGIRNGVKEWSLDASSVQYVIIKKQAIFNDLKLTYFLEGKNEIYITAQKGILNTESKDIEIFGNVVVKNKDYNLKTERLFFDNTKRKIFSKSPVRIFDGSSFLTATSMTLDLNTNDVKFDGVRGEFTGEMSL